MSDLRKVLAGRPSLVTRRQEVPLQLGFQVVTKGSKRSLVTFFGVSREFWKGLSGIFLFVEFLSTCGNIFDSVPSVFTVKVNSAPLKYRCSNSHPDGRVLLIYCDRASLFALIIWWSCLILSVVIYRGWWSCCGVSSSTSAIETRGMRPPIIRDVFC